MPDDCCYKRWESVVQGDEPVFILRGNDSLAPMIIQQWIDAAFEFNISAEKINQAEKHLADIKEYQKNNPSKAKLPD